MLSEDCAEAAHVDRDRDIELLYLRRLERFFGVREGSISTTLKPYFVISRARPKPMPAVAPMTTAQGSLPWW